MKRIFIAGLSAVIAGSGVYAQSLEERVEALEFQGYEQFFKTSGSLEFRADYFDAEDKKADTKTSDKFTRLFLNLDMESQPSERLTFYGRLSMAKYLSVISGGVGDIPGKDGADDLGIGAIESDSRVFVERAFANYAINDSLTFTFGRLPTIDGAPQHHHKNLPMAGNYPILAYSAIFDGVALTKSFGDHSVRAVYTPNTLPEFDSRTREITGPDGKVSRTADAYALMYEYNANVSWARKAHVIGMFFTGDETTLAAQGQVTDLRLKMARYSLYAEALGIANTNFDVAVHGLHTKHTSKGRMSVDMGGSPVPIGGFLTSKDEEKLDGNAYGLLVKYNFTDGFLQNSALGVEYFHGDKSVFLYDQANVDPFSMYLTHGDAYRVFYTKDLAGGLKWNVQYMNQQVDTAYTNELFGDGQDADKENSFVSTSFIAYF